MATRITTNIQRRNGAGSQSFIVEENFEEVMDRVMPLQQPSSTLEARQKMTFTEDGTGHRLYIPPQCIIWAEEDAESDMEDGA